MRRTTRCYPGATKPGVDDNAYTNVMAVWCLLRALDVTQRIPAGLLQPLFEQLAITTQNLSFWRELTQRLFVPLQKNGAVLDQFAGFEDLEPFPWDSYRERYGNIERLDNILAAEGDSPNPYQVCKQPDVLMLLYLLPEAELTALLEGLGHQLKPNSYRQTIDDYQERTVNGSTLSRVVNAWVLTRFDRDCSWKNLTQALGSDLCDIQGGSTREGIHIGATAGTIDIFQRAYLGLEVHADCMSLSPRLPPELPELRIRLRHRNQWLDVHITRHRLQVSSEAHGDGAITLKVAGRSYAMSPGSVHTITLEGTTSWPGQTPVIEPRSHYQNSWKRLGECLGLR